MRLTVGERERETQGRVTTLPHFGNTSDGGLGFVSTSDGGLGFVGVGK